MGHRRVAGLAAALVLGACPAARAAAPELSPSDSLTVADPAQLTGKRVNLPKPDCGARPSDCNEIDLVNQLDGFDLDPRVEVRFGAPIDVKKVTPDTVYVERADGAGGRIGLNRLVWSPARNALYGAPSALLDESITYRLVVTDALSGQGASTTFTTMTATEPLQQMRRALDDGSAYDAPGTPPVDRGLRFAGAFPAAQVLRIRRLEDQHPGDLVTEDVVNTALQNAETYAFGSFQSPSWL